MSIDDQIRARALDEITEDSLGWWLHESCGDIDLDTITTAGERALEFAVRALHEVIASCEPTDEARRYDEWADADRAYEQYRDGELDA